MEIDIWTAIFGYPEPIWLSARLGVSSSDTPVLYQAIKMSQIGLVNLGHNEMEDMQQMSIHFLELKALNFDCKFT